MSSVSSTSVSKRFTLPHLPWVAKWLTLKEAILKLLQLSASSIAVVLLLTWNITPGITVITTNSLIIRDVKGEHDFRNYWYFYIAVGLWTACYTVLLLFFGFIGIRDRPRLRSFLALLSTLLLLVAGPIMSATISLMEYTRYAKENEVNFIIPKVAVGFGFLSLILFVIDVLLTFLAINKYKQSKKFINEAVSIISTTNPQIIEVQRQRSAVSRSRSNIIKKDSSILRRRSHQGDREPLHSAV